MRRHRRYIIPHTITADTPAAKYNPGHYVALSMSQRNTASGTDTGTFTRPDNSTGNYSDGSLIGGHTGTKNGRTAATGPASPGVKGVILPYFWKELETSKGHYDFTDVEATLYQCQALNLQLIVMVWVRTFNGSSGTGAVNPAPSYALNSGNMNVPPYCTNYTPSNGGYQISRWDDEILTRWNLLMAAMSAQFDTHPNFEGVATQETACNMSTAEQTAAGYTPAKYYAALKTESDYTRANFNYSNHFAYHNFVPGDTGALDYAGNYALYIASKRRSVLGGPDILPDGSLQTSVYPDYDAIYARAYPNNGPTFCSAQHDTYTQTTRTMQQIFDFSTGNLVIGGRSLHLDYIMWDLHDANDPHSFGTHVRPICATTPDFHVYDPP